MNEKKIKIGKISYINDAPVYFGLDHGLLPPWLEMVSDVPAVLNEKIKTGQIKISPVSAAFYAMNHREFLLLPDLSISCDGRVMSVILASNYKIDDLDAKKVIFSKESASAAAFLKMIFRRKKVSPIFEVGATNNYQKMALDADAALIIGDAALLHPWEEVFNYCIDLGQLWHDMTKLPFVFAVWVVRRSFAAKNPYLTRKIHQLLLTSKDLGYRNIDKVIDAGTNKLGLERSVIKEYFDLLYCDLDAKKIKAMALFFDYLFDQAILKEKVDIQFFN